MTSNSNAKVGIANGKSELLQGGVSSSSDLYDVSSFDPLQANAQQLTASAGLMNALTAQQRSSVGGEGNKMSHPGSTDARSHVALQHQLQQPPQGYNPLQSLPQHANSHQLQSLPQHANAHQLQSLPQHANAQATAATPHPYMLLNHGTNPLQQLQPIASTAAGVNPTTVVSQGFYLPGSTMPITTNFPAQVLPGTNQHLNGMLHHQPAFLQHLNPAGKRETQEFQQESRKKHRGLQPSVVSVTTMGSNGTNQVTSSSSPPADTDNEQDIDTSNMTPAQRRRHERNLREQQRSSKISQQVKELRDLLSDSNVPFKPNKYSILLNVVDYIKQLQGRAIMLDAEHKKLITTIRRTNEIVQSGNTPSSADETDATNLTGNSSSDPGSENEMVFVQGLNYKSVFQQSPAALGVAALDGILLDCNEEFELLLGFPRDDLLNNNLFNLVQNHEEMYRAMSKMLGPTDQAPLGLGRNSPSSAAATPAFWTGPVVSKRDNIKLTMNVTLTVGNDGAPKFFTCSVTRA
ncbi:unnamed protein product [Cylindrotheca closterium]|uniref:BHLH domain-containing protein n=1 Tax=Cylindrotheca closterium TaxID=2856 RepID=A0AAD2FZT5_9STRA|nr:unnamed protein product [Cylindrotheca closterium]